MKQFEEKLLTNGRADERTNAGDNTGETGRSKSQSFDI